MCLCYVSKAVGFRVEFVITNRLVCYSALVSCITSYLDSEYILQRIQFQEHLLAKLERAYRETIYPTLYMVKNLRGLAVNLGRIRNWDDSAGYIFAICYNTHLPSADKPLSSMQALFAIDLFVIQLL